jgi:hypothetical protein
MCFMYITSSEGLEHDEEEDNNNCMVYDFCPRCFAEKKHRRQPMSAGGDVRMARYAGG